MESTTNVTTENQTNKQQKTDIYTHAVTNILSPYTQWISVYVPLPLPVCIHKHVCERASQFDTKWNARKKRTCSNGFRCIRNVCLELNWCASVWLSHYVHDEVHCSYMCIGLFVFCFSFRFQNVSSVWQHHRIRWLIFVVENETNLYVDFEYSHCFTPKELKTAFQLAFLRQIFISENIFFMNFSWIFFF